MTIAFVGLGGAGGNVANEAAKVGFFSCAINFSQMDLDSLDSIDSKYKLKVMGSDGVGHDRSLAISLVTEHIHMVLNFLRESLSNPSLKIIFVPFGTGGGSGSGMAPIVTDILSQMLDKTIVSVPIMSDETEMLIAQMNTYYSMSELYNQNVCILPIDNNQVRVNHNVIKKKLFDITNLTFVDLVVKLQTYTEMASRNGNFDTRDLVTVFTQRGVACIAETEITSLPKADISPIGIAKSIYGSWETSIFAPIQYERVAKCAFIFDGQESLMQQINYKDIFSSFEQGVPIDLFEGYYNNENGRIITVLTGLPWCITRIESIEKLIEEDKNKANSVINSEETVKFHPKLFNIPQNSTKKAQVASISDVLSKYRR